MSAVGKFRRARCAECKTPCYPYKAQTLAHDDPAQGCPIGTWSAYTPPTKREMLASAGAAAVAVVRSVVHHEPVLAPDWEQGLRKAECAPCEFWDAAALSGIGRCLKCGCFKVKLMVASQTCPVRKWPERGEMTNGAASSIAHLPSSISVTPPPSP